MVRAYGAQVIIINCTADPPPNRIMFLLDRKSTQKMSPRSNLYIIIINMHSIQTLRWCFCDFCFCFCDVSIWVCVRKSELQIQMLKKRKWCNWTFRSLNGARVPNIYLFIIYKQFCCWLIFDFYETRRRLTSNGIAFDARARKPK